MTNSELMVSVLDHTAAAHEELQRIAVMGQSAPVPAERFTRAMGHLRVAAAAVTELERLARGGAKPETGN